MPAVCTNRKTIRPRLHHFRLTTANLHAMVGWYARVFGMVPHASTPARAQTVSGLTAAWGTNDRANPRITIVSLSGVTANRPPSGHQKPQRVTLECATIDELLTAYRRLKGLGIEPVHAVDHGGWTAFYYDDPDCNRVELAVPNFDNSEESSELTHSSLEFASKPMGAYVDPEMMAAARTSGMPAAELHRRAHAGEFRPPRLMGPRGLP